MSLKTHVLTIGWLVASLAPALHAAESAARKGMAIAEEAERRDTGWESLSVDLEMVLRNRHGEESSRALRSRALEVADDGDKTLVVFELPADVKGTALLSFSHKSGDDDQWLYLPALKRVKRISSSNRSGPFVGSEFAYEDISSQEVEKYTYRYLNDEDLEGLACFVVERIPVHPKSGYTRQVIWIDQQEYRTQKVDYYDRKGELLKSLTARDYRRYRGRYWRPDRMSMHNHQTGKSTELIFSNYSFGSGLTGRDFDRASLARAR